MFEPKVSENVRLLNANEAELLRHNKLSRSKWIETGLYLLCEGVDSFIAFDYGERQAYLEAFNSLQGKCWEKHFKSPLKALDWLYETKK